jgi:hypothetical protein
MRRFLCVLAMMAMAVPAWPAKKITVGELEDLLKQLRAENKTDQQIATALKQVQLSEELTRSTMNDLAVYAPGPETTEQIYVLEAGSAVLMPPARDIATQPAMDATAQKALLDKMNDYMVKNYSQLPALKATKTIARFQDNVEAPAPSSGMVGGGGAVTTGSLLANPSQYIRYLGSSVTQVESVNGIEKAQVTEKGARWGANGRIALFGPEPNLNAVVREAQDSGGLTFVRWELINGKTTAVFSFAVQKKKSQYAVDYCCFPDVLAGAGAAGGNYQTATDWRDFTAKNVPYHGELFLNPDTGIVVRLVTIAEFKSSAVVRQEDRRIDYLPVAVSGKELILPVQSMVNTEVVPNGDSGTMGKFTTRRTMLTSECKDFQLVSK